MKKLILILGILLFLSSCYSNPKDLDKIKELDSIIYEKNIEIDNLEQKMINYELEVNNNDSEKEFECIALINNDSRIKNKDIIGDIYYDKNSSMCYFTTIKTIENVRTCEQKYKQIFSYKNINEELGSCSEYRGMDCVTNAFDNRDCSNFNSFIDNFN